MSAPDTLRLKRKRTDNPPESLLLARAADDLNAALPNKRIRYVIQDTQPQTQSSETAGVKPAKKRIFHLKRAADDDLDDGDRKRCREDVPTIQEQARRVSSQTSLPEVNNMAEQQHDNPAKRPGRGSAIPSTRAIKTSTLPPRPDVQSLADTMHEFALDQIATTSKPAISKPRMSPKQAKLRHEQRMASNSSNGSRKTSAGSDAMDTEDDFVYDTYILTSNGIQDDELLGDVAYLVINEHDDEYWHDLLAQVEAEEHENSDEEDENAEDHYGADYPEDELASDDEFNQNAYSFRRRANSDLEQWDHREQSDHENDSESDDDLAEYDNFGNKGRMVRRWEDELGIPRVKKSVA